MRGYYDRQGKPMDLMEWARSFENPESKRVALDELENCEVSTVWLGLNHQFGNGPPLIFETMIFGGEHDREEWRYSTEAEALEGHARALALVRGEVNV